MPSRCIYLKGEMRMIRLSPDERKLQADLMNQLIEVGELIKLEPDILVRINARRELNAADLAYGNKSFVECQKLIDQALMYLSEQ